MTIVLKAAVSAVVAANIIDLAASLVQVYSGVVKEKQKILFWQTIQLGLQIFSMCLLGAFTGAISNVLSVIRNILGYKDKINTPVKVILIGVQLVLTILFSDGTLISWVPFAVCAVYILFMDIKDPIRFKILVTLTFIPWIFYFLYFRSYTGSAFALITTIANLISLHQMIKASHK